MKLILTEVWANIISGNGQANSISLLNSAIISHWMRAHKSLFLLYKRCLKKWEEREKELEKLIVLAGICLAALIHILHFFFEIGPLFVSIRCSLFDCLFGFLAEFRDLVHNTPLPFLGWADLA